MCVNDEPEHVIMIILENIYRKMWELHKEELYNFSLFTQYF